MQWRQIRPNDNKCLVYNVFNIWSYASVASEAGEAVSVDLAPQGPDTQAVGQCQRDGCETLLGTNMRRGNTRRWQFLILCSRIWFRGFLLAIAAVAVTVREEAAQEETVQQDTEQGGGDGPSVMNLSPSRCWKSARLLWAAEEILKSARQEKNYHARHSPHFLLLVYCQWDRM